MSAILSRPQCVKTGNEVNLSLWWRYISMAQYKKDVTPFLGIFTALLHIIEWEILHLLIILSINETQYLRRYEHLRERKRRNSKILPPNEKKKLVQERRNSTWNAVTSFFHWYFEVCLKFYFFKNCHKQLIALSLSYRSFPERTLYVLTFDKLIKIV